MYDDPDAIGAAERQHYAGCDHCQVLHAAAADDARASASLLALPDLKVDVDSAFKQMQGSPVARPRFGFRLPIVRPASRPMLAGLAAAAVLVVLVVGAFANVLTVFQPKTVEPLPISVGDVQSLPDLSAYGDITWSLKPQPQLVTSAAEAQRMSGLTVPVATSLPAGVSTTITYAAMPQATGVFTFSAAKAAAAAAKTGKALPAMPRGMDGSTLVVTVGPVVAEIYGNLQTGAASGPYELNLPQVVIVKSSVPVVTSTGVTVKQLENFLLEQPGLSPQLAAQIRAIGDPKATLYIPVPVQFATSAKVRIQGVDGVALGDNTGLGAAVIWIKKGAVYGVAGLLKQDAVIDIAKNLK